MKLLNKIIFSYLVVCPFLFLQTNLVAQDNATVGVSEFSIKYIAKDRSVNTKDLVKAYGNIEKVYWTKNQTQRISLLKEDTIRINYTNQIDSIRYVRYKNDPFFYAFYYPRDSSFHYLKFDSNILIDDVLCDVYSDSSRSITAYIKKNKSLNLGYTNNFRDLIKLELVKDSYIIIKEKINQEYNFDTLKVFHINKDIIVKPYSLCSNWDSIKPKIDHFRELFYKKNKFPDYLLFKDMEGEVRLSFIINKNGRAIKPKISPISFRYSFSFEKISNKRKIDRTTRIIEKKILKNYSECIDSIQFDVPISNGESTNILIRMPLSYYYYSND